jgi:hypothetical protein
MPLANGMDVDSRFLLPYRCYMRNGLQFRTFRPGQWPA